MPNSLKKNTRIISAALAEFYAKPVAKISLELFLSISLVIVLVVVAIKPTLGTIAQLNAEIEEKNALLAQLRNKNAALQTVSQLVMREQSNIALLSQVMPPTPSIMTLLKMIEKIAMDSNVIITNLSLGAVPEEIDDTTPGKKASLMNIPLTVSVVGTYADIRTFVENIDNSRRILDIITITFSLDENKGTKLLKANISMNAPYYGSNP